MSFVAGCAAGMAASATMGMGWHLARNGGVGRACSTLGAIIKKTTTAPTPGRLSDGKGKGVRKRTLFVVLLLLLTLATLANVSMLNDATATASQSQRLSQRPIKSVLLKRGLKGARNDSVWIGIKTGPSKEYAERRGKWRQSDCPEAYAAAGIGRKFFVGSPIEDGHDLVRKIQSGRATEVEKTMERQLEQEANKHTDLEFLAMRDQYQDITNKLLGILRYSLMMTTADYIVVHDDDYCLNVDVLKKMIKEHKEEKKITRRKCVMEDVGCFGGEDLPGSGNVTETPSECKALCGNTPGCQFYTHNTGNRRCYVKDFCQRTRAAATSGYLNCNPDGYVTFPPHHGLYYLFGGVLYHKGNEYESMKGTEGPLQVAPYYSGQGWVMSRGLVETIMDADGHHTAMHGHYGTLADDANVGKWIKHAELKHKITVDFRTEKTLMTEILSILN